MLLLINAPAGANSQGFDTDSSPPSFLKGLEKVANEVADPECRSVAQRAAKELNRVGNEGKTVPPKKKDPATVAESINGLIAARQPAAAADAVFATTLAYVGTLCAALQVRPGLGAGQWGGGRERDALVVAVVWGCFLRVCKHVLRQLLVPAAKSAN